MSISAKQSRGHEPDDMEIVIADAQTAAEAPHYGLLALLAIALFAITVSQLDRMATAPQSAPAALFLSAR